MTKGCDHVTKFGKLLIFTMTASFGIFYYLSSYETNRISGVFWGNQTRNSSKKITGSGTLALNIQEFLKRAPVTRKPNSFQIIVNNNNNNNTDDNINRCPDTDMCNNSFYCNNGNEQSCLEGHVTGCRMYMTLTKAMGRMGNHMFQYASLLGIAHRHGYIPYVKQGFPITKWFSLPYTCNINVTHSLKINETHSSTYTNISPLDGNRNYTLTGFFQSWKYFGSIQETVKRALQLKDEYLQPAKSFMTNITVSGRDNICVHVRRGDLNSQVARQRGYVIAHLGYIVKAMNYFRYKVRNVQFIVLSDDLSWCRENIIARDVIFSPFYAGATDMALMTLCDHVIVTSGTFGWWGAWLGGGTTVYFKGYPAPGSWLARQVNVADYYLPNWIGLD